jgi:hypothetical protein
VTWLLLSLLAVVVLLAVALVAAVMAFQVDER